MHFRTLTVAALAALLMAGLAGCTTPEEPSGSDGETTTTNAASTATGSGSTGGSSRDLFGDHTGGTLRSGEINQAGSSTVFPLAEAWAEEFGGERNVLLKVAGGGSSVGASKLCAKEIDLGDMSRTMRDAEKASCTANGVTPTEWKIAYDALSVVVSPQNTFVQDLTVSQLRKIFQRDNHAQYWHEVDPSFPQEPIRLCIPGSDSGTFEYFNEAILGSSTARPRTGLGVQQSEDDNILVKCVADDKNAVGYFGLAYVVENDGSHGGAAKIRAIKVGGVAPSEATVVAKTYTPLSRFVYIYTNGVPKDNLLQDYLYYVLSAGGGQSIVHEVGYVKLDDASRDAMLAQLNA